MFKPTEIDMKRIERVNRMIFEEGLSQAKFADKIHMSPENLNRLIKMKHRLSEATAEQIVTYFPKYRLEWLLGYDDYMTEDEKTRADYDYADSLVEKRNQIADCMWGIIENSLQKDGLSLKFVHRQGCHLDSFERLRADCYYSIVDDDGKELKRLTSLEMAHFEQKIEKIVDFLTDDLLNSVPIFS